MWQAAEGEPVGLLVGAPRPQTLNPVGRQPEAAQTRGTLLSLPTHRRLAPRPSPPHLPALPTCTSGLNGSSSAIRRNRCSSSSALRLSAAILRSSSCGRRTAGAQAGAEQGAECAEMQGLSGWPR